MDLKNKNQPPRTIEEVDLIISEFNNSDLYKKYTDHGDLNMSNWAGMRILSKMAKDGIIKDSPQIRGGKKGGIKTRDSGKLKEAAEKAKQYFIENPEDLKKIVSENGKKTFKKMNTTNIECPKCGKIGPANSWKRYHFDNCGIPQNPFGHITKEENLKNQRKGLIKVIEAQKEEATENALKIVDLARSLYSTDDLIPLTIFSKQCKEAGLRISPYYILENLYFKDPIFEKVPFGVSGKYFKYKLIKNEK